ncbi:hypothetical protein [Cloacibacillus evryensis]|uniref:hypothetical protein n=1 Tax=Cloacibacillus evryensis TaxID=508460 RepID=UPI002B1EF3E8|nr:hypothetical protein [Cloacibacillus evryensis]MEA5034355.1 hypothetical protein [Cloacibacillus evryensis]
MKNIYELKIYDTVLLEFSLEETGLGLKAEILSVAEDQTYRFPLEMPLTEKRMLSWLESRLIPKHRAYADEILDVLGLSIGDTKGIIDASMGLSLNDSYWVVPSGFNKTFAEFNFYDNQFNDILSLTAFTGRKAPLGHIVRSPELTTGGMLPKAWSRTKDSDIYLYKGGTSGAANSGNEPYSEYYACQIAKAMGLNAVQYDLEYWKGFLASKCRLFTDINTAFIPIGRLVRSGGLKACLDYCAGLGEDFSEAVSSMLVFDAVIYNEDRHFGNFGILRNNRSGEIIGPAPIFDNGFSLFNYAMPEDIADLAKYAKTRSPVYGGVTFERICSEVMGVIQVQQLQKLIGFKFTRHLSINWQEERLEAIEAHIQDRVSWFLEISRHKDARLREG